jgi:hypothetical protein
MRPKCLTATTPPSNSIARVGIRPDGRVKSTRASDPAARGRCPKGCYRSEAKILLGEVEAGSDPIAERHGFDRAGLYPREAGSSAPSPRFEPASIRCAINSIVINSTLSKDQKNEAFASGARLALSRDRIAFSVEVARWVRQAQEAGRAGSKRWLSGLRKMDPKAFNFQPCSRGSHRNRRHFRSGNGLGV